ncbi:hypothetical protein [uncultured Prochlorococcus sp.]|jgi:hypothetical protein|uniref:hypothetical protein n=1 Tax=Prochlorococcus sp. TaxID=1220 RepID=UPI000E07A99B|nr:hypothetical protein [uncultured Prochlorococcus sp.]RCL49484.1 MAG: hypothetical protein DBW86_04445 [Prochlorococcus sp. MED-G72]
MNFLGLNSPAIFVISVIVLIILGPKRIEKGWLLFQRLLKFLLSNKEEISNENLNSVSQLDLEPEVIEIKEELVEVKSEEPEVIEVKEELVEVKSEKPEVIEVKEELVEAKSEKPEVIEVKEELVEAKTKTKKPKSKKS